MDREAVQAERVKCLKAYAPSSLDDKTWPKLGSHQLSCLLSLGNIQTSWHAKLMLTGSPSPRLTANLFMSFAAAVLMYMGAISSGGMWSSTSLRATFRRPATHIAILKVRWPRSRHNSMCLHSMHITLCGCDAGRPSMTADGFTGDLFRRLPYAVFEYANELGSTKTDKYFRGQSNYGNIIADSRNQHDRPGCTPCFLVEVQGPHLR